LHNTLAQVLSYDDGKINFGDTNIRGGGGGDDNNNKFLLLTF
jgi:hypothetical protein